MCKETAIKEEKCELELYLFTYLTLTKRKKLFPCCVDQSPKKQMLFPGQISARYYPLEGTRQWSSKTVDTFPVKYNNPAFENLDYRYTASIK